MSSDMRDYLDGNVPLTPEQQQARADTYAHAGMVEVSRPEVINVSQGRRLKAGDLLNDFEVLTKHMGMSDEEAEKAASKLKVQKLQDLKMQIIAQNPYFGAAGVPLPDEEPTKVLESKAASSPAPVKGVMVFYFNVGALSPEKAVEYVENYKNRLNEKGFLDRLKRQDIEFMFLPVREQETTVEYIKL